MCDERFGRSRQRWSPYDAGSSVQVCNRWPSIIHPGLPLVYLPPPAAEREFAAPCLMRRHPFRRPDHCSSVVLTLSSRMPPPKRVSSRLPASRKKVFCTDILREFKADAGQPWCVRPSSPGLPGHHPCLAGTHLCRLVDEQCWSSGVVHKRPPQDRLESRNCSSACDVCPSASLSLFRRRTFQDVVRAVEVV